MKYKSILENQIRKISYSKKEVSLFKNEAKKLIAELKKQNLESKIGGSLAKGTLIKSKKIPDIDIFVIFKNEKEISSLGKKLRNIKAYGKLKKIHGSRDYYQIIKKDLIFELVPVVKIDEPKLAKNVTDVSLLHVNYVSKKIKENPNLADEIKLAKAFMKAQNLYGAEGYIQGFSGYSLELLIIHFGSFLKFLKNIPKTKIIDSEKKFLNKRYIPMELNTSKLQSPIILIDPTYKYRNASAGLDKETFDKFINLSKEFLKNPSENFFEKKEFSREEFIERNKSKEVKILSLIFETNKQEGDIAGTKMKKYFKFISKELERKGQKILNKDFVYQGKGKISEGFIALTYSPSIIIKGPPVKLTSQVDQFKKNHKEVFNDKNFYYAKESVRLRDIIQSTRKIENEINVKLKEFNII